LPERGWSFFLYGKGGRGKARGKVPVERKREKGYDGGVSFFSQCTKVVHPLSKRKRLKSGAFPKKKR